MRAIFYIDGFNFYYRRTKNQPQYKWHNLKTLADVIVPDTTSVLEVKYYTAPVSGKIDSGAPVRQQKLFAAFATVPEISVFHGRFLYSEKWAGLAKPPKAKPDGYNWGPTPPDVVFIKKTEEKGSDVNLGVHLVRDAFISAFDIAYVLTNDTDLVEPIRIVTEEVKKQVCLVVPARSRNQKQPMPSPSLEAVSSFKHYIDDAELAQSQFPDIIIRQGKKEIIRPAEWF